MREPEESESAQYWRLEGRMRRVWCCKEEEWADGKKKEEWAESKKEERAEGENNEWAKWSSQVSTCSGFLPDEEDGKGEKFLMLVLLAYRYDTDRRFEITGRADLSSGRWKRLHTTTAL